MAYSGFELSFGPVWLLVHKQWLKPIIDAMITMTWFDCFVFRSLLMSYGVCAAQYSMRLHMSASVLPQGNTLHVVCDVTDWVLQTNLFIVWLRRAPNGEEVEISTNEHLNGVFLESGRYNATCERSAYSTVVYQLVITDVRSSDSGEIICRYPGNLDVSANFTVLVPVQSVRLTSKDLSRTHAIVYTDGQPVVFNEDEYRHLYCDVIGSYPEPRVAIFIDDYDITHQFTRTVQLVRDPASRTFYYHVTLTKDAFRVGYEHDNKTLTCVAIDNYHVFNDKSSSIVLILAAYAPKLSCQSTETFATLYQSNVTLQCLVRSQPAITKSQATVLWPRTSYGNVSIAAGERNGHYFADLVPGHLGSERILLLYINRVYPQHFRTYFFTARNMIGSTERQLVLKHSETMASSVSKSTVNALRWTCGVLISRMLASMV